MAQKTKKTEIIYLRVTPDLKERLIKAADKSNLSLTAICALALNSYLKPYKNDPMINAPLSAIEQ